MKFILIAITLSSWDHSIKDVKTIGSFETMQACQAEKAVIIKELDRFQSATIVSCEESK